MIGQTLAHYKILEKIGSGGMGEVYLAEDTKLDRKVALKVLPPEMAESEERRAWFKREAKAIAALNHPNIVTVHSVEEADGVHFITMELVQGKTLTELIPKKGMPLNQFFELAIPLADAVSAAHQKGIIHRDLKPDNLMQDEERRLKTLDFGLAKWRQEIREAGLSELPTQAATGEGRILGTVAYMSPEQAEGKTVDHRSDIFSIGIILYEMATGQRPFTGETAASVLSSIIKETPPSIPEVNPALPKLLGRIVRRCLAKDRERRYQSAKEIPKRAGGIRPRKRIRRGRTLLKRTGSRGKFQLRMGLTLRLRLEQASTIRVWMRSFRYCATPWACLITAWRSGRSGRGFRLPPPRSSNAPKQWPTPCCRFFATWKHFCSGGRVIPRMELRRCPPSNWRC